MSIAVACPHCETKLNVRDDMAGKRGKCPKCNQSIDIPASSSAKPATTTVTASPAVTFTPDQVAAAVREALEALPTKPPGNAGSAAMVCTLTRGLHYLLPLLFGGLLAYHVIMNGSWLTNDGPPGPIAYYVLLAAGILLTAMSVLSHLGAPRPQPARGIPVDAKAAPLLHELLGEAARKLDAPTLKCAAMWDAKLHDDHGQLCLGASTLGNLSVAEVLGVLTRELAVYRDAGRRAARAEYNRLSRLLGHREPGESVPLGGKLLGALGSLGRPVTWPLMVMVRATCEGELRQAELDADAIACELVGSRAFLTTIQRRRLVDYAAEMTQADIAYQYQDRSLRANRIAMVLDNMQTLPEEVQQSILETSVDDAPTADYQPTWSERIAAIQKLAAPGVLKCPAPAKLLLSDFEGLCKDVTWLDYSQRWGDAVKRRDLK